jgi:hypothetical protein
VALTVAKDFTTDRNGKMSTTDSNDSEMTLRDHFEETFREIQVIHSASIVCREACKSSNLECGPELATTIQHSIVLPLDELLGKIIELLGGKTEFTEEGGS